jgi:hypothetical protein
MNKIESILEKSQNNTILFLGKFLNIMQEDLAKFTQKLGFEFATNYEDTKSYALIVLSSILNPIEEDISYQLYEQNIPDCKLEEFESFYAKSIKPNALLMSLKLSNNQDRVVSFLKSKAVDNELFLKLFKLYNWQNEGLFDNDNNRDITLSFINRFFVKRENFNHNDIAHSPASILDIALTSTNQDALEALLKIPEYRIRQRDKTKIAPTNIKETVALNPNINRATIRYLLNLNETKIDYFLAKNPNLTKDEQLQLFNRGNTQLLSNLAKNPNLDIEIFAKLLSSSAKEIVLIYQTITKEHFKLLNQNDIEIVVKNPNIKDIYKELLGLSKSIDISLASNVSLDKKDIQKLYKKYGKEISYSLASNPKTPSDILNKIYKIDDINLTKLIAQNPSTPQEIIYSLCQKDDYLLNRDLAKNPNLPDDYIEFFKLDNELLRIMSQVPQLVEKISKKEYI